MIKNTGLHGLPQDMWWVYKLFDPHALRKLHPKEFIIVDRQGRLGLGTFALPPWHKREKENILTETGLELQYFQPAAKEENLRALIVEALSSLPPEPEPSEVAAWIKENKGVDASPVAIGQQLRSIGYRTDFVFRDGKGRRVIRKNP